MCRINCHWHQTVSKIKLNTRLEMNYDFNWWKVYINKLNSRLEISYESIDGKCTEMKLSSWKEK